MTSTPRSWEDNSSQTDVLVKHLGIRRGLELVTSLKQFNLTLWVCTVVAPQTNLQHISLHLYISLHTTNGGITLTEYFKFLLLMWASHIFATNKFFSI